MMNTDVKSSPQSQSGDVDWIVEESAELNSIRTAVNDQGMNPIWVHLIKQFGSVMYQKGLESSLPPQHIRVRRSA